MQDMHAAQASMYPLQRITIVCVTSRVVQALRMVRLGAEVLLRGFSALSQPNGNLCGAVVLAGAGMERWQGCRAVECCTRVAAGGVLRLMLACRELAGCLLRPPRLHCKDPLWVPALRRCGSSNTTRGLTHTTSNTCCSAQCTQLPGQVTQC